MQKLVWRVKLVADLGAGPAAEIEVAQIEREDWAVPETLGLTLVEGKRITAAIQTEMVRAQTSAMGERFKYCAHCELALSSKGYRSVTFRSLFGDVPLRVRRFVSCQCREIAEEPRSFSALTLEGGMAPELAYVTATFAALAPFAKVADLLAELLPVGGAINGGTVRNRTRRVGERIARLLPEGVADPDIDAVTPGVVIGLDGGYLRSRHRRPERNFEVIAGKCSILMARSITSLCAQRQLCERICQRRCERRGSPWNADNCNFRWRCWIMEAAAASPARCNHRPRLVSHRHAF